MMPDLPGEADQAAIALHEMFKSYQRAGFSRREAVLDDDIGPVRRRPGQGG